MPNIIQITGFPLIKFQCEEYIEKLQQGIMYMKNLEWYRQYEIANSDSFIGDSYEASLHMKDAKLIIPESGEEIEIINGNIPTVYSNDFVF